MSSADATDAPTTESVSPKVIVPSIAIIALLVLVILVGAVIIIMRAYRARQRRRGVRLPKNAGDAERAVGMNRRISRIGQRESMWRSGAGWEATVRNGRLTRDRSDPRLAVGRRGSTVLSRPNSIVRPPSRLVVRQARPFSFDPHQLVGEGFQRNVKSDGEHIKKTVTVGYGYTVSEMGSTSPGSVHVAEIALGVAPAASMAKHQRSSSVSKIERMTGNKLSNDLYDPRPSGPAGRSQRRSSTSARRRDTKGFSYPPIRNSSLNNVTGFQAVRDSATSSPISTTDLSRVSTREDSIIVNALTPTPPSPLPAIPPLAASRFPNIAALAQANASSGLFGTSANSKRLSYSNTEHIASQFNPTRSRFPANTAPRSASQATVSPPRRTDRKASATFGPLPSPSTAQEVSRSSSQVTVKPAAGQDRRAEELARRASSQHRRSWNGRSVLLLDDNNNNNNTGESTPAQPGPSSSDPTLDSSSHQLLSPIELESSRPSRSPRARVSAFGPSPAAQPSSSSPQQQQQQRPPLPPIPSRSPSKASVLSMPSTLSSFHTVTRGPMPVLGGLSPAPPPRPRSEISITSVEHSLAPHRRSVATVSSGWTDASSVAPSQVSNLTEYELQREMQMIRERANRSSMERKRVRREMEEEEVRMYYEELARQEEIERQRTGYMEGGGTGEGDGEGEGEGVGGPGQQGVPLPYAVDEEEETESVGMSFL